MRTWGWIKNHQTQATIVAVAGLLVASLALVRDYYDVQASKPNPGSASQSPVPVGPSRLPEPVVSSSPAETPRPRTPTDPPDRPAVPPAVGNVEVSPPSRTVTEPRGPAVVQELSFTLRAERTTANTVRVLPVVSGRAQAGRTYWFMIEADWGNGNTDYFPRRQVSATTPAFEVSIPPEGDVTFVRHGRIYALTGSESAEAESMRQRQQQQAGGTVRHDTYFTNPPSQSASNAVRLPF